MKACGPPGDGQAPDAAGPNLAASGLSRRAEKSAGRVNQTPIPNVFRTMLSHLDPGFDAAFDELFPRAYRLAYRLLGQVEAAEDVAAEALARAFARWSKIAHLDHREAWVLRVT